MSGPRGVLAALVPLLLVACGEGQGNSNTMTGAASHAKMFPIATGDTHGPGVGQTSAQCDACHVDATTGKPAVSFTIFSCTTCHVPVASGSTAFHDNTGGLLAALHAADGVTNFTFTDASCLACHPDGAGGAPANHEALFPRASGTKHAGIACSSCHTNPSNRKDLTAFACYACHVALTVPPATVPLLAGHAVSGYGIAVVQTSQGASTPVDMTSSVNCLRCHGDAQVNLVRSHPGGDGGFSRSEHDQAGCLTCHSTMRSDKAWAANFRATSGCVICHPNGTGG